MIRRYGSHERGSAINPPNKPEHYLIREEPNVNREHWDLPAVHDDVLPEIRKYDISGSTQLARLFDLDYRATPKQWIFVAEHASGNEKRAFANAALQ